MPESSRSLGSVAGAGSSHRWSVLVCSTAVFVVTIDGTTVNVALPSIGSTFGAGTSGLQWIIDGYLLVLACGLLSAGAAGDRFGRRRVFQIGLAVFGLASAAASLAPSLSALVVFRMLQGLGAAMLPPSSLAIIATTFPDRRERARAMGTWGALSGLAVASGPLLGGILVALVGWRSIFWVNVPIVLVALAATHRHVGESRGPRGRGPDLVGQALAVIGLATLADALIQAPDRGWASPLTLLLVAAAVAATVAFVLVEQRREHPLLALDFFRDRAFSGAAAIATLMFFAISGFTFVSTLYLQNVRGYSPLLAGFALAPATVMTLPLAPFSGRLTARFGARRPLVLATGMMTIGLLGLAQVRDGESLLPILVAYLAVGIGMGMVNPPVTTTAVSALPPEQAGVAAGVTGTARQVGALFGVAVLGALLERPAGGTHRTLHAVHSGLGTAFLHASHLGFTTAAVATALAGLISLCTLDGRASTIRDGVARSPGRDPAGAGGALVLVDHHNRRANTPEEPWR